MGLSKENRKKLESVDIEKLKEEITEEEAFDIVFNDEKLTEIFFDFLDDYLDTDEDNLEDTLDYNDPEYLDSQYVVITGNYIELTDLYGIHPELSFNFPDYSDCRTICVDGKHYELEELIANDEEFKQDSKELLYEIDALCADIPYDLQTILENVEKYFAERIAIEISDRNQ